MHPSDEEKRRLKPAATITYGIESPNLGLRYGAINTFLFVDENIVFKQLVKIALDLNRTGLTPDTCD